MISILPFTTNNTNITTIEIPTNKIQQNCEKLMSSQRICQNSYIYMYKKISTLKNIKTLEIISLALNDKQYNNNINLQFIIINRNYLNLWVM